MKYFFAVIILTFFLTATLALGYWLGQQHPNQNLFSLLSYSPSQLISPLTSTIEPTPKPLPLNQYSIPNLKEYPFESSKILVTQVVEEQETFTTYLFSYQTMGKTMTGSANIPQECIEKTSCPVVVLVRGYATPEQYSPGFGTRNAAAVFANNGYITLAPDFFGFANSDPEPEDPWEARFIKPINVIELIHSIKDNPNLQISPSVASSTDNSSAEDLTNTIDLTNFVTANPSQINIWAHSNGGQITLSVMQVMEESIPATLWAPVTAPFPYSILFFTRTSADEGKEARAWLAMFERDYDVLDFTITQHLDKLTGPIQIHHGSRDPDALQAWSDSLIRKIELENERREKIEEVDLELEAGSQLEINSNQEPVEFEYYVYPQADHNLQPSENWNQAIARDLEFFAQYK